MKSMKEYTIDFGVKNIKKGTISKITNYSFVFTTNPKKDNVQPKSVTYMLNYFYKKEE